MTDSKETCEMLPCPLCGRQPDYQHFNISQNTKGRIICTCGLGLTQGRNDTEDGTILKWNTRSDHAVQAANERKVDEHDTVPVTKYLMALDDARKSNMDAGRWERIARDHQSKCESLKQTNADLRRIIDDMKAATVGTAMTLDQAIERIERFMGDYAKLLLASTLYVERDEPTDQHAFNVAERKEEQMARDLAEALATVGGYAITFAPTLDRPHETMVGETVYDSEGNAIGWVANARTKEATE